MATELVTPRENALHIRTAEAPGDAQSLIARSISETERKLLLENERTEFALNSDMATLFAKSGAFADVKGATPEQAQAVAFVKIELGRSMGFSTAESMQGIHLIGGVPSVSSNLRASRMQRAGFSWEIDWFDGSSGVCEGCRLWLYRHGKPLLKPLRNPDGTRVIGADGTPALEHVSVSFLKADAENLKTKLWEGNGNNRTCRTVSVLEKDNWKSTPANMYFARAISNAQRWYAPGVLSGDIPSTEEAMDFVVADDPRPQQPPPETTGVRSVAPATQPLSGNAAPDTPKPVFRDPKLDDVPEGVTALWSYMGTGGTKIENVLNQLKRQIEELSGSDKAFRETLGHAGMTAVEDCRKVKLGVSRQVVRDLYLTVERWRKANTPPADGPVTEDRDSWVPQFNDIGGGEHGDQSAGVKEP